MVKNAVKGTNHGLKLLYDSQTLKNLKRRFRNIFFIRQFIFTAHSVSEWTCGVDAIKSSTLIDLGLSTLEILLFVYQNETFSPDIVLSLNSNMKIYFEILFIKF